MLGNNFIRSGFSFIDSSTYLKTISDVDSLRELSRFFETNLRADGPRNRAYLKLEWDRHYDLIRVSQNQSYFQSAETNTDDGGSVRIFEVMDPAVMDVPVVKSMIEQNKRFIASYEPLSSHNKLIFGMHFIQYIVDKNSASYSSPVGLHVDDEPLVFVHLIELSDEALGGDNLIATIDEQVITNVIRLENPLDTIVLNNNCYHAVTPLGSKSGVSKRNIILFTVEPESTQISEKPDHEQFNVQPQGAQLEGMM